jgi:peptide/nickel transport system substrate-binding protein
MRKRLFAMLATAAIAVTACGGTTSQPPSAPASTEPTLAPTPTPEIVRLDDSDYKDKVEEGVDGGTIIIGDWQEANQFNPFYVGQVTEANVASAAWANLYTLTYDLRYAPDLATSIPTIDNGGVVLDQGGDAMTVTWELRPDLKWSDGEPLTCDDFLYSVEWIKDPDNVGVIITPFDVSTVECKSDTTLIHHFEEVYEGYITAFTVPLPRHYLESIPMTEQVNGAGFRANEVVNAPTSGAFSFESVTPGAELRLKKNPNYTSWATGKPAHLDNLVWRWYGDTTSLIAGYRAGEVDFVTDLAESDVPAIEDLGDQVSAIPALLYEFLRPNWADGKNADAESGVGGCSRNPSVLAERGEGCPMSDPAMREAIAWAVNKEEINDRILFGQAQVANGSITPSAWFYSEQPATSYDPAKAKDILEKAGWVDSDGDGVREKDGVKAIIELCTTTLQRRVDTLALHTAWLADVGIKAIPNPVSASDIFADYNEATIDTPCALSHSNFDLAEHAFSSSIDPLGGYFNYHSSQFEPNGANDAQVNDPDLDASYDVVRSTVNFKEVRDAMATVQQVFYEKTVEIPLYYRKSIEIQGPNLGNFFANGTQAGPTWNAADWYFKG